MDFNLLNSEKEELVYEKVRNFILIFGSIHDDSKKFFGLLIVLDYEIGERKLKISNRKFENRYEIKNLLGIRMKVMVLPDMFAHKLCALLDRNELTNRDIFDVHYFIKLRTPVNKQLVESKMNTSLNEYLQNCIIILENTSDKGMLNGLGELMDEATIKFVRTKLRIETIDLLRMYKEFPILS